MINERTIDCSAQNRRSSGRLRLTVIAGAHTGLELITSQIGELTAGRGEDSNLRLDKEPLISRRHFRLDINPPWVRLIDLGSTNGTELNGLIVTKATLSSGDVIVIGETRIKIGIEVPVDLHASNVALQPTELFSTPTNDPKYEVSIGICAEVAKLPTSIGGYNVVRELGRGGMAIVYEAVHEKSRKKVAVKLIREEVASLSKLRQLFAREATILSQMKHPFIVRAHHLGFHEDRLFLVMDYLPAFELCALIDSFTPEKKIRSACWVMQRILQALQYAHARGIVHRDVKPTNILAYRDGKRLSVKLSDFGLAKCFADAGLGGLTEEKSIRGTLGFMAPEQITDSKNVGPATDIYAVGACLVRLITQRYPVAPIVGYQADRWQSVDCIPNALCEIIDRSLQFEAEDRYPDAESFANALAPFAQKDLQS